MKSRFSKILKITACVFLASAVWALSLVYSQNLPNKSKWISRKAELEMLPLGGLSAAKSRAMTAGAQLNLQKYYGFQEMLYGKNFEPRQIAWKFKINKNSHLDIVFNKSEYSEAAIRISTKQGLLYYEADSEGRFSFKKDLTEIAFGSNEWFFAELNQNDFGLSLKIDRKQIILLENKKFISGLVGFRSGLEGAVVSSFSLKNVDGQVVEENFFNTEGIEKATFYNFLAALTAFALLSLLLVKIKIQSALDKATRAAFVLLLLGIIYFIFDFFLHSRIETKIVGNESHAIEPILKSFDFEYYRHKAFNRWARAVGLIADTAQKQAISKLNSSEVVVCEGHNKCKAMSAEEYSNEVKSAADINILFFGGSFGRGMGANKLDQAIFKRAHDLVMSWAKTKKVRTLSFSTDLTRRDQSVPLIEYQIKTFEKIFANEKLDLLIYTFINIDENQKQNIAKFLEKLREKKTKNLFLVQPFVASKITNENSKNIQRAVVGKKLHDFLQTEKAAWYDPQFMLLDAETKILGNLWWDRAHLTSFGQNLLVKELFPLIIENIKR